MPHKASVTVTKAPTQSLDSHFSPESPVMLGEERGNYELSIKSLDLIPNAQSLPTRYSYFSFKFNPSLSQWGNKVHFLRCKNISLRWKESSLIHFRTDVSMPLRVTTGNWDFNFKSCTHACMFTSTGRNTGSGIKFCR